MKDLMGHSFDLGLRDLSEVFEQAFDWDVRNAIAHADYTLVQDGMRLRMRNGDQVREIPWVEFESIMSRGLNLFSFICQIADEYVKSYHPPKTVTSRMNNNEPLMDFTIYFDPTNGAFGFTTGKDPPANYNKPEDNS